ncbi:MAG: hypothetical protein KY476_11745 [Planctomycetes bacterium]|nr:hypothetical protein [Planctomycetota bacterium]
MVETTLLAGEQVPDEIAAYLTVEDANGVPLYLGEPVWYDPTGFTPGEEIRFALQADLSEVPTGRYPYELELVAHYSTGPARQFYNGEIEILNLNGRTIEQADGSTQWQAFGAFGPGWALSDVPRVFESLLYPGVLLSWGNSSEPLWFEEDGLGGYVRPAGVFDELTATAGGWNLTDKFGTVYAFDADGLVTSRTDRNGNVTTFAYIDADGDGQAFEIDRITETTFGREVLFAYAAGFLDSITDSAGRIFDVVADQWGLWSVTTPDPDGAGVHGPQQTAFSYYGNLLDSVTTADQRIDEFVYRSNRLDAHNWNDGLTANGSQSYDPSTLVGMADGNGFRSNPVSLARPADAVARRIDFAGNEHRYKTDHRLGLVTEYTNPLGRTDVYEHDADGLMTRITLNQGGSPSQVFDFTHDAKGNLTGIQWPDLTSITWAFDAQFSQLTSHSDESGHTWSHTLDANGNRIETTDPAGHSTTYTYTPAGLPGSITRPDPDGAGPLVAPVTAFTYDASGRLTTITNPDGTTQQFAWDSADNLTSLIDELALATAFAYDALGRRTSMTDPAARVTTYDYDDGNRLSSITLPDAGGGSPVYNYSYDARGRLMSSTEPDGHSTSYEHNNFFQVTSVFDAEGGQTTFEYDAAGRLVTMTKPDPDDIGPLLGPVWQYAYDTLDRRTSITNPLGHATTFAYDDRDRVTSITDALGGVLQYQYAADGSLTAETDQLGRQTSYAYDALHRLTSVTLPDADGAGPLGSPVTSYSFDPLGRLTSITDPNGNATTYAWDVMSRLTSVTDALGGVGSFAYDTAGRRTSSTDPLGRVTTYAWDDSDNLTTLTRPDPDGAGPLTSPVITYAYDTLGRVTSVTDALSNNTSYAYDQADRITSVTDALGGVTSWTYNGFGQVTSVTDALANTTNSTYDPLGRLSTVTDALGGVASYGWDAAGNQTSLTLPDPDGEGFGDPAPQFTYAYDALGRNTSITDPLGNVETFAYDAAGQMTSSTDQLSRTTTYAWDGVGRLTGVTDPLSQTTQYAYDAAGNLTSVTDPLSNVTSYQYDGLHRRTGITDAAGGITTFSYDAVGNLTGLTDPVGNATAWAWDDLDRLTSETDPLGAVRSYDYDAADNLTRYTDRLGRITEYAYDALYRPTQETWLAADGITVVNTIDSVFDAAGRLTSVGEDFSAYAYMYDALGRATSVDNFGTPGVPHVVLDSTYNALGNRTRLSATLDGTFDFQNDYTYDAAGRMTRIAQTDGDPAAGYTIADKRIDLRYSDAHELIQIDRYEDLDAIALVAITSFAHDAAGRLTDLTHTQRVTTLADYDWTYDDAGRITSFASSADGTSSFTYDTTAQLTAANHTYQADEGYSYDANGNPTGAAYTVGTDNRLLSDATYDYEYDAEGNRTRRTDKATGDYLDYEWDHRNRLLAVEHRTSAGTLTKRVELDYDAFDRLIAKRVDDDGNGTFDRASSYVYDGADLILVFDDAGSLTSRLLHGPAIDQVFADEDALGEILWNLSDNQQTVRDVADYDAGSDTTSVVNHLQYTSFGEIASQTNAAFEPIHTYTGQVWDADVDAYHYNARWYDPHARRFLSLDPLGLGPDTNAYRYVGNSPTNFVDPTGLFGLGEPVAADKGDLIVEPATFDMRQFNDSVLWKPYTAQQLLAMGRSIGTNVELVNHQGFNSYQLQLIRQGQATVAWSGIPRRGHYFDEFGAHYSFCMSCHDRTNHASRLKMQCARASMNTTEVVTGQFIAYELVFGGMGYLSRFAPAGSTATTLNRGTQLRLRHGDLFEEYMRFRGQGFTPAQSHYLAKPYQGKGHHFLIPQRAAPHFPEWMVENPLNVLKPNLSRGRFYELHFRVDPYFYAAPFPRSIGGAWRGNDLALTKCGPLGRLWYGSPGPLKATSASVAGGVTLSFQEWFYGDNE